MRILILENCPKIGPMLSAAFRARGHSVLLVTDQETAQAELLVSEFDSAMMSQHLLGTRPFNLADYIRLTRPSLQLVLLQGQMQVDQSWTSDFDWIARRPTTVSQITAFVEYFFDSGAIRSPRKSNHVTLVKTTLRGIVPPKRLN